MYIGLDIGTSSVKAILLGEDQSLIASATAELTVERPHPGWSEQDPDSWWRACETVLDALKAEAPKAMAAVRGIGLSGHMHGATLLDAAGTPLRPCILWNDGRSGKQCSELEAAEPKFLTLGGNRVMPGFTAPKLQWVRENEPDIFARTKMVLLPKDYVRFKLTGEYVGEMSDAAGTLWLDVARRDWSDALLAATGLTRQNMPRLVEGSESSGTLKAELCGRWGFDAAPVVAGGGGDNAASACGVGAVDPGSAFVSLGTSGVLFVTNDRFSPNVDSAVHAFCHAVPDTWHQMGVILSATDSLNWLAKVLKRRPGELTGLVGKVEGPSPVSFMPYLGGERTPHNDVDIRAGFFGISHATDDAELCHAVLDGVAFALKDCLEALSVAGTRIERVLAVGGGSRSTVWLEIIASLLNVPVDVPVDGDFGGSLGAARLGQAAALGTTEGIFSKPALKTSIDPVPALTQRYAEGYERWRKLYPALKQAGF
ncbi:putative xylulose kinase protein [Stappia aggregata IAM 12614]|uniref:Xylulose kinase n=1 Tax=Roseibium aggregatum (strain ATCC 25650 / DSM 13394 / JCM 20685 / NBRC 16684 / NCIMB 2208 / IAM 12614 / B1) TaxID=384765 RepID=A0P1L0_ROSAI|nr:xylulokinase [Roseibium aggregatum]EAV41161.1 putative xylulose kinase protein [Stappia aggregata IAM 12614] [Roseibium aggregatum IAM 12614]